MPGQFKLDENLPRDAEALFLAAGHDVQTALGEQLGGATDRNVLEVAGGESRILVTLDADFADIRRYPPSEYPGIWVLRPHSQSVPNILTLLRGAVALLDRESAHETLWIIEQGRVRIHQ